MEKIKQKNTWEVYGNDFQINFLKSNIQDNDIAHAYLFSGPESIGKKKIAISFIKSVFCENYNNGEICQKCDSCKRIDKNIVPDIKIIEGNNQIKIEEIRNIISDLSLKPFNSKYKVAIIDNAERMGDEAANALLKTLEEPTGFAIIILITKNDKSVMPTIVSRTRRLKFFKSSDNNIKNIEQKICKNSSGIAYLAEGKIGKLINIDNNSEFLEFIKNCKEDLNNLFRMQIFEKMFFAEKLYQEYEKTPELFIERINIMILELRKKIKNDIDLNNNNAKMFISSEKAYELIDFLTWVKNNLNNTKSGFNYKLIIDKIVLNIINE